MYPISALVRRTFYQDKAARHRYLAIAGRRRSMRDNYFGDTQEYHYEPAADIVYRFSPTGAQLGK